MLVQRWYNVVLSTPTSTNGPNNISKLDQRYHAFWEQFKSTRIYTLSQFPRQNLIKKLAITLFAIFLTVGNDFSFFFFYKRKEEIKIWTN